MKILITMAWVTTVMMSSVVITYANASSNNMAHAHIGHVMTKWSDTPEQWGFLPTAMKESEIAAYHAEIATSNLGDLAFMQTHVKHTLHALDPSIISEGPGRGYGVVNAAINTANHISASEKSSEATPNIKLHSTHVRASADNAANWAKEAVLLSQKILTASSAAKAAPMVQQLKVITDALITGVDANGDGQISWKKGEGGLGVANIHMEIMMKGEGL
jgi:hypothetical protein